MFRSTGRSCGQAQRQHGGGLQPRRHAVPVLRSQCRQQARFQQVRAGRQDRQGHADRAQPSAPSAAWHGRSVDHGQKVHGAGVGVLRPAGSAERPSPPERGPPQQWPNGRGARDPARKVGDVRLRCGPPRAGTARPPAGLSHRTDRTACRTRLPTGTAPPSGAGPRRTRAERRSPRSPGHRVPPRRSAVGAPPAAETAMGQRCQSVASRSASLISLSAPVSRV